MVGVCITDIGLRNTCVFIWFFGYGIANHMYFHWVFWVWDCKSYVFSLGFFGFFLVLEKILTKNRNGSGADLGSDPKSVWDSPEQNLIDFYLNFN